MRCGRNGNKIIGMLLAVTGLIRSQTATGETRPGIPWSPELLAWYECGGKVASDKTEPGQVKAAMYALGTESVDTRPEFLMFAASVMSAESGFNRYAISPAGAIGLMQVTIIGAKEAAIQCRLPYARGVNDSVLLARLMDSRANVKYGTCLLKYYLDSVKGNHTLALVLYNGGYAQLTRFLNTGTLTKETQDYVLRVQSLFGRCTQ